MKEAVKDYLLQTIRTIKDYPEPGVSFKDITTLLADKKAFSLTVDSLCAPFKNRSVDKIVGIEARGFILGSAVAYALGAAFVPIRKKGKLPYKTVSIAYSLEYAVDAMEIHTDAVLKGEKILLIDDLLATGGTAIAAVQLLRQMGADILAGLFVINLPYLKGQEKLTALGLKVESLLELREE